MQAHTAEPRCSSARAGSGAGAARVQGEQEAAAAAGARPLACLLRYALLQGAHLFAAAVPGCRSRHPLVGIRWMRCGPGARCARRGCRTVLRCCRLPWLVQGRCQPPALQGM